MQAAGAGADARWKDPQSLRGPPGARGGAPSLQGRDHRRGATAPSGGDHRDSYPGAASLPRTVVHPPSFLPSSKNRSLWLQARVPPAPFSFSWLQLQLLAGAVFQFYRLARLVGNNTGAVLGTAAWLQWEHGHLSVLLHGGRQPSCLYL